MKKLLPFLVVFLGIYLYIESQELPPESFYTIEELCQSKGYQTQKHSLTTLDGYIISVFRVFKDSPKGKPVLMMHGMSGSATNFVMNPNRKGPAFELVDAGYDVWLGNGRGNVYSRNHTYLDTSSVEFWNWTAADIGSIDIPTTVSYIKNVTSHQKVAYVGHSQGGALMLLALAVNHPVENDISVAVSLAGPGPKNSCKSRMLNFYTSSAYISVLEFLGVLVTMEKPSVFYAKTLQAFPTYTHYLAWDRYDFTIHSDKPHYAYLTLQFPGGISVKSLRYVSQFFNNDNSKVKAFDYGEQRNLQIYGSKDPPVPDYSKIKTKVALFGGKYDRIILPADIEYLYNVTNKDSVVHYRVDYEEDHGGFTFSSNMDYLEDLLKVLEKHS